MVENVPSGEIIKIAIADDHPLVINGVKNIVPIYPHLRLTGSYYDGKTLLSGLAGETPDVLLLDIQLPDQTGDELVPVILKRYPDIKILVVTNFDSPLYANTMLTKGAHGYILKTADNPTLVKGIETVYSGGEFIEPAIKERMELASSKIQEAWTLMTGLTPREKDILQYIVNGYTNKMIAEKLFLSPKTVDNYRTHIMIKLDVNHVAALVKKALQLGLAE